MHERRTFFFTLCLCISTCLLTIPAFGITLLDEFSKAKEGDFAVFEQQKQITLFRIAKKTDKEMTIEEVTATAKPADLNWQAWLTKGAPTHTSWTLSRFDLTTGTIESIYSYGTNEWIQTDSTGNATFTFLPTLFTLPLVAVAENDRKRIGPPPESDEHDRRKLWVPKAIFQGKAHLVPFYVFRVEWPKDVTELSGKAIYLYIPYSKENQSGKFENNDCLNYFPYWVEVVGKISKVKLRVIDSGKNLTSPATLPTLQ